MKKPAFFFTAISVLLATVLLLLAACQKWEDKPGPDDDRLQRPYCNNPEAVNYNWDFPGTPDSTVCYFPSDVFAGDYLLFDTVYSADDEFLSAKTYNVTFSPTDRTHFLLKNFCSGTDIQLTANRYFTATLDTLIPSGQLLCRTADTATGLFLRKVEDTLTFTVNVWSDTSFNVHRGTAVKQ